MIKPSVMGAMFVLLAVSAASADAPSWSPYAIISPSFPTAPMTAASPASGVRENRAAYVEPAAQPNANVPTWSPYTMVPQGR
jgi:hypothetical protein